MWDLKYDTNELIYRAETETHRYTEQSCGYQEEGEAGARWIGSFQLTDVNYYTQNG